MSRYRQRSRSRATTPSPRRSQSPQSMRLADRQIRARRSRSMSPARDDRRDRNVDRISTNSGPRDSSPYSNVSDSEDAVFDGSGLSDEELAMAVSGQVLAEVLTSSDVEDHVSTDGEISDDDLYEETDGEITDNEEDTTDNYWSSLDYSIGTAQRSKFVVIPSGGGVATNSNAARASSSTNAENTIVSHLAMTETAEDDSGTEGDSNTKT